MPDQVRFKELLKDPIYQAWLNRKPSQPSLGYTDAWVVYVQRSVEGNWARATFPTYSAAHRFVGKMLKQNMWDLSLGCLRRDYAPPLIRVRVDGKPKTTLWRGMPEGHVWCGYCRRPTVFRYFTHHHAIPKKLPIIPWDLRCCICGARKVFVKDWYRR